MRTATISILMSIVLGATTFTCWAQDEPTNEQPNQESKDVQSVQSAPSPEYDSTYDDIVPESACSGTAVITYNGKTKEALVYPVKGFSADKPILVVLPFLIFRDRCDKTGGNYASVEIDDGAKKFAEVNGWSFDRSGFAPKNANGEYTSSSRKEWPTSIWKIQYHPGKKALSTVFRMEFFPKELEEIALNTANTNAQIRSLVERKLNVKDKLADLSSFLMVRPVQISRSGNAKLEVTDFIYGDEMLIGEANLSNVSFEQICGSKGVEKTSKGQKTDQSALGHEVVVQFTNLEAFIHFVRNPTSPKFRMYYRYNGAKGPSVRIETKAQRDDLQKEILDLLNNGNRITGQKFINQETRDDLKSLIETSIEQTVIVNMGASSNEGRAMDLLDRFAVTADDCVALLAPSIDAKLPNPKLEEAFIAQLNTEIEREILSRAEDNVKDETTTDSKMHSDITRRAKQIGANHQGAFTIGFGPWQASAAHNIEGGLTKVTEDATVEEAVKAVAERYGTSITEGKDEITFKINTMDVYQVEQKNIRQVVTKTIEGSILENVGAYKETESFTVDCTAKELHNFDTAKEEAYSSKILKEIDDLKKLVSEIIDKVYTPNFKK